MVLWLCAHLPLLPLDALRPGSLGALPMLAWETQGARGSRTVRVVNAAARSLGLTPGLALSMAQALAPQVLVRERDRAREHEFLRQLALALGQLTPHLSVQHPDVLLEIGSCLRLFGGVRRLQRLAHGIALDSGAQQIRWGLASTPLAARLFAHAPGPTPAGSDHADQADKPAPSHRRTPPLRPWARCVQLSSTQHHLRGLPLHLLTEVTPLDSASLTMLHAMGVHHLATLQALPRGGLARRGARAWLDALDRANGALPDPQRWVDVPEHFEALRELPHRADNALALAAEAEHLLQPLVGWLTLRWQAAQRLSLVLLHERRLHAPRDGSAAEAAQDTLQLDLATPSRDGTLLATLLRERLQRHPLRAPVYGLRLVLKLSTDHAGLPGSLVPDEGERARDFGQLLERLRARLGPDRVLRLVPIDDARPECADRAEPINAHTPAASTSGRTPPAKRCKPSPPGARPLAHTSASPACSNAPALSTPPRPTWLLHTPLALDDDNGTPLQEHSDVDGGSRTARRLLLLGKPERIETGWFDEHLVRRDYHVALGRDGVLRWIYVERPVRSETDLGEMDAPRWFLQGVFG